MLGTKYKIITMSKDFGLKSKDLVAVLDKHGRTGRTHMATLTPEEFDIILNDISLANQVERIDSYIYGETMIPRKIPKPEKKKE